MLYLTDLDYDKNVGHNIAEVEIYGIGKMWLKNNGRWNDTELTLVCVIDPF